MATSTARTEADLPAVETADWRARLDTFRRVAVIPAYNEARALGALLAELRECDPALEVVVVDDGSHDGTAAIAAGAGARVVRLPFNLGIGGACQTGFKYALEHGFDVAIRLDGDGQHDPRELSRLLEPLARDEADIVVGSRFLGPERTYRPPRSRLLGIRVLAAIVSLLVRRRVTDTTSGYQALNRRALALFAADYPHDFPEVEAVVMVSRHRLRMVEVPSSMRVRAAGESSITSLGSAYYMIKVLLALFLGLFRRQVVPREDS